jgi:hypothetical protein
MIKCFSDNKLSSTWKDAGAGFSMIEEVIDHADFRDIDVSKSREMRDQSFTP